MQDSRKTKYGVYALISGQINRFLFIVFLSTLSVGCASNKSAVESCADMSEDMHPIVKVPFVLVGCVGTAVVEQAAGLGEALVVSPIAGIGTQVMARTTGDGEPSNFPFHGQWCGPGHPAKGSSPEPEDELDELCRRHDLCYEQRGYFSCRCDVELARSIQSSRTLKKENMKKAGLIVQYFKDSYCKGCKQMVTYGGITWNCHTPENFGCKMGLVSSKSAYAWCPQ